MRSITETSPISGFKEIIQFSSAGQAQNDASLKGF
jgi:hypothetical protein